MITSDYAKMHEFVGRSAELEQLRRAMAESGHRAVLITGTPGVGKTALADRFMENARSATVAFGSRFNRHFWVSAYRQPWTTVMALLGQSMLGRDIVLKATVKELQERVVAAALQERILVVIDNVETSEYEAAADFFRAWVGSSRQSVLLATSLTPFIADPRVAHLPLTGVSAKYAQLLLGEKLQERFASDNLVDRILPLKGVPLSLIYVQWLDPETPEELSEHVGRLTAGTLDRLVAIEDLLAKVTLTPTPFMALGIVRRLQFEESLLAFLWDRMGGGSSEAYVAMRNGLVNVRLLIPVQDMPGTYRINEDIHKQLYRALSTRIGEGRIDNVHFFAAEFFRRQYEQSDTVDDLQSFVHHAVQCREYAWAYTFVFETDVLQRLQRAGLAVQLRSLMDQFLNAEEGFSNAHRARIYLATAAACNDLSDFETCLDQMHRARDVLQGEPAVSGIRRQIAYYSAVAYSNIARSGQCLRNYYEAIAASPAPPDSIACLSLSYMSDELKYHDMSLSLKYGLEALELARRMTDRGLLTRVLCSLAVTEIFTNDAAGAAAHFKEAHDLCYDVDGSRDTRELGRVLKNWGLLDLIQGDLAIADERLSQAGELSASVGDRRRIASGDLYRAICRHRGGDVTGGIADLRTVIAVLDALKDGHYLVPALMTTAYWIAPPFDGQMTTLRHVFHDANDPVVDAVVRVTAEDRFEIYAAFWRKHFKPTVVVPVQEDH
ncbi:MAG TPA: ATP-binding protein [Thermoanaerobaculia bacterium]